MDAREQKLRQRLADARRHRAVVLLSDPGWRARDDAQFAVQEAKSALRRYQAERDADCERKLRHELKVAEDVYARDRSTDRLLSLESARIELNHYLATKATA